MAQEFDVVVAGHICLDIIPSIAEDRMVFMPGRLVETGAAVLSTGGAVSNTGLALNKLGIRVRLMGKTGRDSFGRIIREILDSHDPHMTEGMIEVEGETTSYTVIISPQASDRMFLHCPGCNDTLGGADIDHAMVSRARLFHFGYPPLMKRVIENGGAELLAIFESVKAAGVTTSLDMSMPDPNSVAGRVYWPSVLCAVLPYVDIYLPSFEETLFMLYPDEFRRMEAARDAAPDPALVARIGSDLLSMGPAITGLKMGPYGLYIATAGSNSWSNFGRSRPAELDRWLSRRLWSPCFDAQVAGTTGSGDATIAGFLAALLRGESPETCVTMACAVGGCNVEAPDALGGLRSWDETSQRVAAGWARKQVPLSSPGWQPIEASGVWRSSSDAVRENMRDLHFS